MKTSRNKFAVTSALVIIALATLGASWGSPLAECLIFVFSWVGLSLLNLRKDGDSLDALTIGLSVLVYVYLVGCAYIAVAPAPFGSYWGLMVQFHVVFVSLIILLFYFVIRFWFVKGKVGFTLRTAGTAVLLLLTAAAGLWCGQVVRMHAFAELGKSLTPITSAIKSYEADNKAPPNELIDLVPKYIKALPATTIMGGYPEYKYMKLEPGDGSPWKLSVFCPSFLFTWDEFFYWPSEKYPKGSKDGEEIEPVGNWAYRHD